MIKSSSSSAEGYNSAVYRSYLAPPIFEGKSLVPVKIKNDRIISWLKSALEEGRTFMKAQPAYVGLEKSLDIIKGEYAATNHKMSQVAINYTKRAIREQVAILSNIRQSTTYEPNSSDSHEWIRHSQILNACNRALYQSTHVRQKFKQWVQYAAVQGTGYLLNEWNPNYYGYGVGEINYRVKPFDKVLPIGLGESTNLQDAYANIVIEEPDIRKAWKMFPHQASIITPVLDNASKTAVDDRGMWASIRSAFSRSKSAYATNQVRTRLYYIYINDYAINPTDKPIIMGEGSWQYTVPYVGQQLSPLEIAKEEDCLLYPNKRLIICTETDVLYDGTSFYWHGRFPIVKYSPDEWAFTHLGFSMALETYSLNNSIISTLRGVDDGLALALDPPAMIDDTLTSAKEATKSLRSVGRKIRGRLAMGEFLKPFMPPQAYMPSPLHMAHIEKLEQYIDRLTGLKDLRALQQARQMPSAETIEKFQTEAGSIAEDMSLSMDAPLWELADMNRFNFFQYYNKTRRIRLFGDYGTAPEDNDRDKHYLVPDYRSANDKGVDYFTFEPLSILPQSVSQTTNMYLTREMRARMHVANFSTHIDPASAHEITHINTKMLYLQAFKVSPLLIDPQLLAETLNIPNYGKLKGDTVLERVMAAAELQKNMGLQQQFDASLLTLAIQMLAKQAQDSQSGTLQTLIQQLLTSIGVDVNRTAVSAGLAPPNTEGGVETPPNNDIPIANAKPALGAYLLGGSGGGNGNVGRPSTLREQPRLEVKSDGRGTISSS